MRTGDEGKSIDRSGSFTWQSWRKKMKKGRPRSLAGALGGESLSLSLSALPLYWTRYEYILDVPDFQELLSEESDPVDRSLTTLIERDWAELGAAGLMVALERHSSSQRSILDELFLSTFV